MPRIVETTVYEFHELSDRAKEKARAWFRGGLGDDEGYDEILEDFERICDLIGITLKTRTALLTSHAAYQKACIYFSGFSSQGDGACFEGTYAHEPEAARRIAAYAPHDRELQDIAERLDEVQRAHALALRAAIRHTGRYYHEYSMDISIELDGPDGDAISAGAEDTLAGSLRDLAGWLYRQLEREWEHMMSDAYADEAITANHYTFTVEGRRFG
jgi:hypothetical protein